MKTPFKHWIVPMSLGVVVAFSAQFLFRKLTPAKTQLVDPSSVVTPTPAPTRLQDREAHFAMNYSDARTLLRTEVLGLDTDPQNVGKRETTRAIEVNKFQRAASLLGEFSDDLADAKALIRNLPGDKRFAPPNIGSAIAKIAIRAAAKRGERVTVDPQFFKIWDLDSAVAGSNYIMIFLYGKPSGYLDTVSDWLLWLTHDEQLPKTLAFTKENQGIPIRIYVSLEIIAALEKCPEEHHRKTAATVLAKLKQRYTDDARYPEFLTRLADIRH